MKPAGLSLPSQGLHVEARGQYGADIDDEHHRIADLYLRHKLFEGIEQRPLHDLGIE
jgi:hypothetical protein